MSWRSYSENVITSLYDNTHRKAADNESVFLEATLGVFSSAFLSSAA